MIEVIKEFFEEVKPYIPAIIAGIKYLIELWKKKFRRWAPAPLRADKKGGLVHVHGSS